MSSLLNSAVSSGISALSTGASAISNSIATFADPGCYLIDFACYKPPEELRVIAAEVEHHVKHWKMYSDSRRDFMWKVFVKSGLDPNTTYLPYSCHYKFVKNPKNDVESCMTEAKMVMIGSVTEVLNRLNLDPKDIDILITSNSIFCPTPSLASMLVNHFHMRADIQSYHLGGMGCSNGTISINLARDLLRAHPNSTCLFVCSEVVTAAFYEGDDRSRIVSNVIFRMGGSAMVLSNKPELVRRAKYRLESSVRVHIGASDDAYNCMAWSPDREGNNGIFLGKEIVGEAAKCIDSCIRLITPKIMTPRQYCEAAANKLATAVLGSAAVRPYRPDFAKCVDHFIIHAGGYAVLKGLQEGLGLPSYTMLPSYASLKEYGNTSASTTWYALGYTEACAKVTKGQKVLQLGVGGGMKGGVNIWRAMRNIDGFEHEAWRHLHGSPLTEADLPRGVDMGDVRDSFGSKVVQEIAAREKAVKVAKATAAAAAAAVAAAAASVVTEAVGKPIAGGGGINISAMSAGVVTPHGGEEGFGGKAPYRRNDLSGAEKGDREMGIKGGYSEAERHEVEGLNEEEGLQESVRIPEEERQAVLKRAVEAEEEARRAAEDVDKEDETDHIEAL